MQAEYRYALVANFPSYEAELVTLYNLVFVHCPVLTEHVSRLAVQEGGVFPSFVSHAHAASKVRDALAALHSDG